MAFLPISTKTKLETFFSLHKIIITQSQIPSVAVYPQGRRQRRGCEVEHGPAAVGWDPPDRALLTGRQWDLGNRGSQALLLQPSSGRAVAVKPMSYHHFLHQGR